MVWYGAQLDFERLFKITKLEGIMAAKQKKTPATKFKAPKKSKAKATVKPKAKPNVKTKAKAKPKPAKGGKTLRAGSRGTQPKPKNSALEAQQRVMKTGSVTDAAAAIKALL